MKHFTESPIRRALPTFWVLLLPVSVGLAQAPNAPLLSPEQLNNLVAPVALYPDPLLGQVLAASTYPLEIVEAGQWLQQSNNLTGAQLMDAAKQQNWDPSVQALVAFPDALRLLSNDVRWTTALGNAFLAQQSDVMSAVQRMRAQARASGKLSSTAQQVVTTNTQDNQSAIEIQPADPQVIYVPIYNPAYVWGPPVWGAYPDLWYPPGFGFGFGFGPGIYVGGFFPGWGGWGGWGWGCGWFGNGLFVNTGFFNRYGFRGGFAGGFGAGFGGRSAWAHDPGHRMGVPYSSRAVASRFNSTRFTGSGTTAGQFRGGGNRANSGLATGSAARFGGSAMGAGAQSGGWNRFGGSNSATSSNAARSFRPGSSQYGGGNYGGASQGYRAASPGYHGFSSAPAPHGGSSYSRSFAPTYSAPRGQSYSAPRSFSAPSRSYSAPRSFSAPRSSGGGPAFSSGHSNSGGHSGSSTGHAGGGGGRRR